MRTAILFSVLFSFLPLLSQAQDDLYFTPSKAEQSAYQQAKIEAERSDYYSGIGKTDEEYNRRGQYTYKKIGVDSLGNDIFMSKVSTQHGDSVVLDTIYSGFTRKYEGDKNVLSHVNGIFDLVLANINRNIILEDLETFYSVMSDDAKIILSGFYEQDSKVILQQAIRLGLKESQQLLNQNWCCLLLEKA